jgi:hypothetical protein
VAQVTILGIIAWVESHGARSAVASGQAWSSSCACSRLRGHRGRGSLDTWRILIDNRFKMGLSRLQPAGVDTRRRVNDCHGRLPTRRMARRRRCRSSSLRNCGCCRNQHSVRSCSAGGPEHKAREERPTQPSMPRHPVSQQGRGVKLTRRARGGPLQREPRDARWGDTLKGDESGNGSTVDLEAADVLLSRSSW